MRSRRRTPSKARALRYSDPMHTLARVATFALAGMVMVGLTSCSAPSPEDAFLEAVHSDSRVTQSQDDAKWLELGESTCEVKDFLGPEDIADLGAEQGLVDGAGEQLVAVYEHAVKHLCP